MTPGILSIFCALGTVAGLVIFIFGMARKSTSMKLGGGVTFLICFAGLFLILSKFGEHSENGVYSDDYQQWRIAKWEQRSENNEGKMVAKDLTLQWDGTIYLIIDQGKARFGDQGQSFLNRGFSSTDSTWNFAVGPSPEAPPLSGTYRYSEISSNEAMLTKDASGVTEVIWLRKLN